ncbi:sugar phosphate isomerase/epimerase family protein [Streptomyces sp. NPDC090075]|uniref:sugar phosphate isomerase/epimerase family protein n=1 Tax=Streptomyces sp. NPDC090075 TaxID=3365937 RepID=UPI003806B8FC
MELSLYTDSVPELTLEEALDLTVALGGTAVEIAAGGQSGAPHMDVFTLVENAAERARFADALASRGLRMGAMNCSAWPMHPRKGARHVEIMEAAVRLAEQLGVRKIVTMTGNPGESPDARLTNWIFYPWPPENIELLHRQWDETIAFWQKFAPFAADHGIEKIALELHPLHMVYNVPTLLRLREAVGPVIGANVDPSHMFWQRMDPAAIVRALGPAVHHVHLKDVEYRADQLALAGVLDNRPYSTPEERAWTFRTVGHGHGAEFWAPFIDALAEVGYDDVVSIENEDPVQDAVEGVTDAARFIEPLLH